MRQRSHRHPTTPNTLDPTSVSLAWLPSWREAETVNRERINRRVLLQQLHNLSTSLDAVRADACVDGDVRAGTTTNI